MDSNKTKVIFVINVLLINVVSIISDNLVTNLIANKLLDKNPILNLLQLYTTTKLLKDYQDSYDISNDPKTNYLLFLGKGNIKFENHHLDVENKSETLIDGTTSSYDLAHNKHLLKFVARNGYDVWKRFLVAPHNSSAHGMNSEHTFIESSETIDDMVITTTNLPEIHFKPKPSKGKYDDRYVTTLKNLYKPDLQVIDTENTFIKHEVKPPKWVKNIIDNDSGKRSRTPKAMNKNNYNGFDSNTVNKKARKKTINKFGNVKSDKGHPNKYMNKKINNLVISSDKSVVRPTMRPTVRPTLQSIHKKSNYEIKYEKQNNRIGNIVIKGFNSLIRGIGSLFGIDSNEQ